MLNFLTQKSKIQVHIIREVPIETFKVVGIGQINPYCSERYENEIFLTIVNFINGSGKYDEKEGLVLASHFTVRKCPRCKRNELIPVKLKINLDSKYLKFEEEVAYDAYSEYPSKTNTPSVVSAYCNSCSSCFEIRIKNKDLWVKQAKRLKERDLVNGCWEEYRSR